MYATTGLRALSEMRGMQEVRQDFTGGIVVNEGPCEAEGRSLDRVPAFSTEEQQRLNSNLKYRQLQDIEIRMRGVKNLP